MTRRNSGLTPVAALVALAAMTSAGVGEAASPPARAAVVQAVTDCRKLADQGVRLACYDKAVDALEAAQAEGQVVVIDREQARAVRRQAFGFNIPSISLFPRGPKEEPINMLTVELSSAHSDSTGKWVMTTSEGAVWRQIDDKEILDAPHAGSKVLIKSALLGSYFCKVDGQTAFRCTRER